MRLVILIGVMLLAIGACESANQSDGDHTICAGALNFQDAEQRAAFLGANASRISRHTVRQKAFLLSGARAQLRVFVQDDHCGKVSLDRLFDLSSVESTTRLNAISNAEAVDALENSLVRSDHAEVRGCVVQLSARPEDVGRLGSTLPYMGLLEVQVEGADDAAYVAANESCGLLAEFVANALRRRVEMQSCANASLQQCGFPDEILPSPVNVGAPG